MKLQVRLYLLARGYERPLPQFSGGFDAVETIFGTLLLLALVALSVAGPAEAFPNRKTYEFYAWTYSFGTGTPVTNSVCGCQVGPCPNTYALVGGYTVECDGTRTDEWGYTDWNGQCGAENHPTDRQLVSVESCAQNINQTSIIHEPRADPAGRAGACNVE